MDNWKCVASLRGDGMGGRMENVTFSSSSGLRLPSAALGLAQQQHQMVMGVGAGNRGNSFFWNIHITIDIKVVLTSLIKKIYILTFCIYPNSSHFGVGRKYLLKFPAKFLKNCPIRILSSFWGKWGFLAFLITANVCLDHRAPKLGLLRPEGDEQGGHYGFTQILYPNFFFI